MGFPGSENLRIDRLSLGFGAIVENDDAETLYGFSPQYKFLDDLAPPFLAERLKDAGTGDYHFAVGAMYDYGSGDLYATVGRDRNDDIYFGPGANYKFSSDPLRAFVEYGNGDSIDPDDIITVGLRYDFWSFVSAVRRLIPERRAAAGGFSVFRVIAESSLSP